MNEEGTNRTALVTGGTRGIGRGVCELLKERGYHVVAGYGGNVEKAKAFTDETGIPAYQWDVSDFEACQKAAADIAADNGTISVLVNNAGRLLVKPALDIELEEWNQVLAVNVTGSYFMAQRVAQHMIDTERPGCIINIASTFTVMGASNVSAYGISKAAVVGITRHLAVEWAQYGIRVNAVAPGSVKTKLRAEIMAANPARAEANLAKIPMQRFGTPEDMAGAVSYLASPAAAYVNGHILAVDGGLTIS